MPLPYHTPLDHDALRALGLPAPWTFGIADRTHWNEMDPLAHVNNAAYLAWFENVRLAYLLDRQIMTLEANAPRFVLRQVGVDYHAEITLAEDYIVTARTKEFRNTSFTMEYAVFALRGAQPVLCTTSHAIIVVVAADGSGKMPLSEQVTGQFIALDGATRA